jgi:crotonobetainyl-CoA:carnitine CoA-transferase CaiB-like acyl-CoA transferase
VRLSRSFLVCPTGLRDSDAGSGRSPAAIRPRAHRHSIYRTKDGESRSPVSKCAPWARFLEIIALAVEPGEDRRAPEKVRASCRASSHTTAEAWKQAFADADVCVSRVNDFEQSAKAALTRSSATIIDGPISLPALPLPIAADSEKAGGAMCRPLLQSGQFESRSNGHCGRPSSIVEGFGMVPRPCLATLG